MRIVDAATIWIIANSRRHLHSTSAASIHFIFPKNVGFALYTVQPPNLDIFYFCRIIKVNSIIKTGYYLFAYIKVRIYIVHP